MLNNKAALRIISLVIAILLWIYVMGEVNPETSVRINDIQVNFTNTELLADEDLAVVIEAPITISATIKGKRSKVNATSDKGLTATVDVRGCSEGKNEREINIDLPSGIELDSISQEVLEFTVESRITREKPVEVSFVGDIGDSRLVPWSGDYDFLYLDVSGAQHSVDKIDSVKGVIPIEELSKKSKDFYIDLTPVDEDGNTVYGITLAYDSINVSARFLTAKKVRLNLTTNNLKENLEVQKTSEGKTVKIIGTDEDINDIEEVNGIADLGEITSAGKYKVKVDLVDLPEGIYEFDSKNDIYIEVWVQDAE